ncbi:MAG: squalene synthase HpnC [Planctomycetaceae bacterium]|nr:squalene synthase HpnC [Planctomycetaceae bacterium]
MSVIADLDTWGPNAQRISQVSTEQAEAYCRNFAKSHYENFPVASWLLPRDLRQHFCNVYAYCRWADDLGDEVGDKKRSLELLAWWRDELDRCYDGDVRHPVFVALASTIETYDIPRQPFADLISAFEQDQTVTEYETFAQLLDYCHRSANPVGRIVLHLCRSYGEETARWSDSICTGLQLANFWQDVSRDDDMGRIYLPSEDRERFGYTVDMLQKRVTNDAFLKLMAFEVDRAREMLLAGEPLVHEIKGRLQVDIELFLRGGLQILKEIENIGHRVWDQRPVVRKRQFARLFVSTCLRHLGRRMAPRINRNS